MAENLLYYGDNFDILRRYIKDESGPRDDVSIDRPPRDATFKEAPKAVEKQVKKGELGL